MRHIAVNCLWLQEQCAKKIIPLNKIPGEINTADLMTKHLAITMIIRHMTKLNLVHVGGRSDAAAKLHSMEESMIPSRTSGRIVSSFDLIPTKSYGDYWAGKGEHGWRSRLVRACVRSLGVARRSLRNH